MSIIHTYYLSFFDFNAAVWAIDKAIKTLNAFFKVYNWSKGSPGSGFIKFRIPGFGNVGSKWMVFRAIGI
jgi:hypothetical protein